jgi:hypothetical protein
LRLDRRPQGGGRGAAFIAADFDGGNIGDEDDGVIGNDVALPTSFGKSGFSVSTLTSLVTF